MTDFLITNLQASYQNNGTSFLSSFFIHRLPLQFSCLLAEQLHMECLNICRMKKSQSRNNVTSIKHLMTPYLQVTVTAIILCTLASVSFCSPLLSEWKMTKRLCELWKTLLRTISIGFLVTTRHCIIWPSNRDFLNGLIPCN